MISLKSFDAETKSILSTALRIDPSAKLEFKHATMSSGFQDSRLYVDVEVSKTNLASFVASITFPTHEGRAQDVRPFFDGLPWGKSNGKKWIRSFVPAIASRF
jgi:hypothetical protein